MPPSTPMWRRSDPSFRTVAWGLVGGQLWTAAAAGAAEEARGRRGEVGGRVASYLLRGGRDQTPPSSSCFCPSRSARFTPSSCSCSSSLFKPISLFRDPSGTPHFMDGLKKISATEVRLHNSKDSCWLVIHGKVYDVTKFVDDHPGGEEVLLHASGTGDASQSFEDVGHSATARRRMTKYLIGELEGYDPSKAPPARLAAAGKAVPKKPSFGISDYLLPLFLLFVAVVSWLMADDKKTTATA